MSQDTPLLPAPSSGSRALAVRTWLLGTFAGRALLVGAAVKLVAYRRGF